MESAFLLLGTNLGDRLGQLNRGLEKLARIGTISAISAVYETAPWGISQQPEFWNQAVRLETGLSPTDLMAGLKEIEKECGRQENLRWGPREMDIDILLFGLQKLNLPELNIPHPRLQDRKFALIPLAEIAPNLVHPVFGRTIRELLKACTDNLSVNIINS